MAIGTAIGLWVGPTLLGSAALATIATSVITGAIVGALVGAAVGGLTALITGGDIGQGILNGAVGGAVSGAVLGFAGGVYSAMTTPATTTIAGVGEGMAGVDTVITEGSTMSLLDSAGDATGEIVKAGVSDGGAVTYSALDSAETASLTKSSLAGLDAPTVQSEGITDGLWEGLGEGGQQAALQGVSGVASGLLDSSEDIAAENRDAQLAMNTANNLAMQERQDANAADQLEQLWERQRITEHDRGLRSSTQQRLTMGA